MQTLKKQSAEDESIEAPAPADLNPAASVVAGTLRAPWKWESLLVESAVIGGSERWARRLDGLAEQYPPSDSRADGRRAGLVAHPALRARAAESRAPARLCAPAGRDDLRVARRSDLGRLAAAPRGVRAAHPAEARARAAGARRSAADGAQSDRSRCSKSATSSPTGCCRSKWSRRRIDTDASSSAARIRPGAARSRSCSRRAWRSGCFRRSCARIRCCSTICGSELEKRSVRCKGDRAEVERLLLRLAVGAATDRLYASFPRIESSEARARVPSFYALEIMRAVTGRVPDHQTLERMAAQESQASLAWPAPADAADAIDDFEHDLAVLRAADVQRQRRQRPRALHAHAERLPEAIGHRTLGACAERSGRNTTASSASPTRRGRSSRSSG